MLLPTLVSRLDVLVTHRASVGCLGRLSNKAALISSVLVESTLVDAFFTATALLKVRCLLALSYQVIVVSRNLNHLTAMFAFSEHSAVLPEVDV